MVICCKDQGHHQKGRNLLSTIAARMQKLNRPGREADRPLELRRDYEVPQNYQAYQMVVGKVYRQSDLEDDQDQGPALLVQVI